jgi:hypothetical protein
MFIVMILTKLGAMDTEWMDTDGRTVLVIDLEMIKEAPQKYFYNIYLFTNKM